MSIPPRRPEAESRRAAPERILDAAASRIVAVGAANLSLQDVADAASVSKGLIHYHFKEKETLLAILAQWIGRESVRREAQALVSSTAPTAVDDLWAWLSAELQLGHLRALQDVIDALDALGGELAELAAAEKTCHGSPVRNRV